MKHKLHNLLIEAANDSEARFTCEEFMSPASIGMVISQENCDWVLAEKPKQPKYLYVLGTCDGIKFSLVNDPAKCIGKIEVLND